MQIDEIESRFKSSYKVKFQYEPQEVANILVISKKDKKNAEKIKCVCSRLFPEYPEKISWSLLPEEEFNSTQEVLNAIENIKPDLIVSERDIKVEEESLIYGLSPYVQTLTQVTATPIILLPKGSAEELENKISSCTNVLLETNRLTGDSNIINWGIFFAKPNGILSLCHIEDDKTFTRYADAIEKIPEIQSDLAITRIQEELLKLPQDFSTSVSEQLASKLPDLEIKTIIRLGHSVNDYRDILNSNQVDLLVINSKDENHLAMEGIAYEITVEFKDIPLFLI